MEDSVVSLIYFLLGYIEQDLLMKVIVINGKYVKIYQNVKIYVTARGFSSIRRFRVS